MQDATVHQLSEPTEAGTGKSRFLKGYLSLTGKVGNIDIFPPYTSAPWRPFLDITAPDTVQERRTFTMGRRRGCL
ncbi:MAG: hypothetical protein JJK57_10450 [Komagataeibacter hansenii]|nr:hypothetical protein [Novacetimonas hansenii]